MIAKMMTGKPKLSVKNIEYLRKDDPEKSKQDTEYLRKDDAKNPVYLGGYINVECRQKNYDALTESEQNKLIEMTMNTMIERHKDRIPANGVGVRHFTFSPDPKKMKHLSKNEQEKLIIKATRETMKKFKDTFYKQDQIGFVFSVHKDKAHMHSHVYMATLTKKGHYISMNAGLHRNGKDGYQYINEKSITDKLKYLKTASKNSFDKEINRSLSKQKQNQFSKKKTFKNKFLKKATRRLKADYGLKEYEYELNKQSYVR